MAFDINEKPFWMPIVIGLVFGAVGWYLMDTQVFEPKRQEIQRVETDIDSLKREVEKGRAAKQNLPKLREEIANLELELERLKRILPTKRETDDLIKKLKQLTEAGRFQLNSFRPQGFADEGFYSRWPINVQLEGTYHELGLLFDRLSRFSRIINVASLTLRPSTSRTSSFTINANFTMQTFIYKEEGTQ